mmetsp:Transcript_1158/g.3009  ORF Transcript_1158/g.3009 Transcript_1158/m.3009 type:complete len:206 (-) Transcript_1158:28-645(-)
MSLSTAARLWRISAYSASGRAMGERSVGSATRSKTSGGSCSIVLPALPCAPVGGLQGSAPDVAQKNLRLPQRPAVSLPSPRMWKSVRLARAPSCPCSKTADKSTPSNDRPLGSAAPESAANVGMRSRVLTSALLLRPGPARCPNHRKTPSTRWPPSHVVVLKVEPPPPGPYRCHAPTYGPASPMASQATDPRSAGPLSDVRTTSV